MVETAPPCFPLRSARTAGRGDDTSIPSLSPPLDPTSPHRSPSLCCALPLCPPCPLPRSHESPKFSLSSPSSTPPRIESNPPRPARSADPAPESPNPLPIEPDRSPPIPPDSSPRRRGGPPESADWTRIRAFRMRAQRRPADLGFRRA